MGDFNIFGLGRSGSALIDISAAIVTLVSSSFTYDGTEKTQSVASVVLNGVTLTEDRDYVVMNNSATNAGTHTLKVVGIVDYSGTVPTSWNIARAVLTRPALVSSSFTYDGSAHTVQLDSAYDASKMSKDGNETATNAGSYSLRVSLQDSVNYEWDNHTTTPLSFPWSIAKRQYAKPTITGSLVYNASAQAPTLVGYVSSAMTQSGNTSATNAGNYTLVVSLNDTANNEWSDSTTASVNLAWSIAKLQYAKPTVTGSLIYNTSTQSPTLTGYDSTSMNQSGDTSATNAGSYTLTISLTDTTNNEWSDNTTAPVNLAWSIAKAQGSVSVSPASLSITGEGSTDTSTVTVVGDGTVSVASADTSIATATLSGSTVTVTVVDEGDVDVTVTLADGANYLGATAVIAVECSVVTNGIYGAYWSYGTSTAFSRTDDAALFANPVPAVSGGTGSSPFDNIMPWKGIVRETVDGNEMVKIPKFWYKCTLSGSSSSKLIFKIQIANYAANGFNVSPAHANRGDGKGVRDYVYVGRYHCGSDYTSKTGVSPIANITSATARSGCKALGAGYYQLDYAMWWTIRMLYLVEFANWNSQAKIGYGGGDGSAAHNSGASDSAQYHTGTMQADRTTYGAGVQYRYIEDPWGNVFDWCDGILINGYYWYVSKKPDDYSSTNISNYVKIYNVPMTGDSKYTCISNWEKSSTTGFEWAYVPSATVSNTNNYDTYCADFCTYRPSDGVVRVGGGYGQSKQYGLFAMVRSTATSTNASCGARLQYLP